MSKYIFSHKLKDETPKIKINFDLNFTLVRSTSLLQGWGVGSFLPHRIFVFFPFSPFLHIHLSLHAPPSTTTTRPLRHLHDLNLCWCALHFPPTCLSSAQFLSWFNGSTYAPFVDTWCGSTSEDRLEIRRSNTWNMISNFRFENSSSRLRWSFEVCFC